MAPRSPILKSVLPAMSPTTKVHAPSGANQPVRQVEKIVEIRSPVANGQGSSTPARHSQRVGAPTPPSAHAQQSTPAVRAIPSQQPSHHLPRHNVPPVAPAPSSLHSVVNMEPAAPANPESATHNTISWASTSHVPRASHNRVMPGL